MFNRKFMSLKINIVSPGRFHVCDLARELDKNGWDVRFYSFVPTNRTIKFGLPAKCNKTVLPFVLPFIILQKYCHLAAHKEEKEANERAEKERDFKIC